MEFTYKVIKDEVINTVVGLLTEREYKLLLTGKMKGIAAFWEEEALQFMKDIDTAKRQGDYGVVTDFGESCITCFSTGCKFGLLVLYLTRKPA